MKSMKGIFAFSVLAYSKLRCVLACFVLAYSVIALSATTKINSVVRMTDCSVKETQLWAYLYWRKKHVKRISTTAEATSFREVHLCLCTDTLAVSDAQTSCFRAVSMSCTFPSAHSLWCMYISWSNTGVRPGAFYWYAARVPVLQFCDHVLIAKNDALAQFSSSGHLFMSSPVHPGPVTRHAFVDVARRAIRAVVLVSWPYGGAWTVVHSPCHVNSLFFAGVASHKGRVGPGIKFWSRVLLHAVVRADWKATENRWLALMTFYCVDAQ